MRILSCTCSLLIFLGAFILLLPNANASDSSEPLSQKSSIQITVLSRQTYEIPTNSLGGISSLEFDLGFSDGGSVSSIFLSSSTSNLSPQSSTVGGTVANNAICTISEEPAHLIPLHVFGITARIASNLLKISRSELEIYYFYLDTTLSLSIYRVGNSEQTTFKHIGKKPVDFGGMFEFKIDPNNTLDLSLGRRSATTTQSKSQDDDGVNTSGNYNNNNNSQSQQQSKDKYVRFLKLLQWREELLCVIDNVLFLFNQDKAELLLDLPAYPYSVEILGDMLIITCSDSGEILVYSIGFINSTTTTTTNSKPTSDQISIKKVQKINKKVLAFEQIQVLYDRVYISNSRVIHVYLTTPDNVLAQACRIDVLTSQDQVIESIYANKDLLVAVVAVLDQSDKSLVKSREIREFLVKRSFLESQSHPSQVACFKQVKSDIHRSLPMNQKQQSWNSAIFDDSHIYYVSKHGILAIRKGIPDALLVGDSRNVWELRYDSLNMQRIESVQVESTTTTTAKTTKQSGGLFIVASSTVISLLRVHRSDPILKCDARRLLEGRSSSLDGSLVNSGSANNNRRNSVEMKLVFSSLNCGESTSRSSGSAQQEMRSNDGLFSLAMRSVEGAGCVFEQDLRVYAVPFEVNSTKDEEDFLFGISLAGCVGVLCFAAFMFCQSRYVESGAGSNTASSERGKKGASDKQKILPQQNRKVNFLSRFRKGSQGNDLESDDLSSSNVNVNRTPSSASTSSSSSKKKRNSSVEMNSSAQILVGTRQSKRKLLNGNTPSSSSNGAASVSISTTTHGVESEEDEEQGISKLFSTKAALADSVLTPEEKEAIIITKSKEHQKYLQQVLQDDEFLKLPQEEQDEFLHEQYQFHLDFQRQLKLQNIQRTGGGNAVVIKRGKNSQAKARDVPVHEKFAEKVDAILETESDKKASTRRGQETLYRMQRRSKLMEHNRNSNWNKFNEWRDEKSNNDRSGRNAAAGGGGGAVAAAANVSVISQGNQDIVRTGIPLMTLQSIQKSLAQEKGNREEMDGDVIYVNGNGGIIDAAGVYHNGFDENEDGRDDGDDDDEDITGVNGNVDAGDNPNADYQNVYEEEEDDNHGAETKASESQPQSAQSAPQVSRSSNSEIGSNRISGVRKSSNEQVVSMSQQEERLVDDLEINRKLGDNGGGGEEKSQGNEGKEEEKQGGIHSDSLEEDADDQSLSL